MATSTGMRCESLVRGLLSCEQCLEIHISGNDGSSDQHRPVAADTWWIPHLEVVQPHSVIFAEGNLLRSAPIQ